MFKNIKEAFANPDLKRRILLTILLIVIFRLGCWIPVPGINTTEFGSAIKDQTFLSLLSGISGGALANTSLLSLGVSPYISASIIVQLLTVAIPSLERASKNGEEGRKKIATWTKYCALILAIAQSIGIVSAYSEYINTSMLGYETAKWVVGTFIVIVMVAGAMFTYFLGEKITEYGVANGLSLLIFVGILSSAASALVTVIVNIFTASSLTNAGTYIWQLILFLAVLILIFGLIVFMDTAERKLPISYAKQIRGRKMFGGQTTYIPIRVLATGVMPIIFASSILTFPQLLTSIFWAGSKFDIWWQKWLGAGTPIYSVTVGILILFFAYFYSQISFNPEEVARQIQQNGGFINGMRQGRTTAEYLAKINNRLTLFGAIFLAFIAIVPTLIFTAIGSGSSLINAFSSTGMLIVVSVSLECDKQLEAQLMMKTHKGFLK